MGKSKILFECTDGGMNQMIRNQLPKHLVDRVVILDHNDIKYPESIKFGKQGEGKSSCISNQPLYIFGEMSSGRNGMPDFDPDTF